MTDGNIVWVEVSRYCMPWHGEYDICRVKVERAVRWILETETIQKPLYYRYPTLMQSDRTDRSEVFLPTHLGFASEEDASYFKLCCDI